MDLTRMLLGLDSEVGYATDQSLEREFGQNKKLNTERWGCAFIAQRLSDLRKMVHVHVDLLRCSSLRLAQLLHDQHLSLR